MSNQLKRGREISEKEEEKSARKRKKNHLKRGTVINEKKEEKSVKDRERNQCQTEGEKEGQ